jgi:hypothetical protein
MGMPTPVAHSKGPFVKRIALTAAAIAVTGIASAVPSAFATDGHNNGGTHPTAQAHRSAPAAASSAAAYNGACGSGYSVIDSLPISTTGTVYLTYNGTNGYNCVVTIRSNPGTAVFMLAAIELTGSGNWVRDKGYYTTYAGPVYLHAAGQCIDWDGQIGSDANAEGNSHCH